MLLKTDHVCTEFVSFACAPCFLVVFLHVVNKLLSLRQQTDRQTDADRKWFSICHRDPDRNQLSVSSVTSEVEEIEAGERKKAGKASEG